MLSKNMYAVLSCFPRTISKPIKYEILLEKCELSSDEVNECLNETLFPAWNYVRCSNGFKMGSDLYLTESGLVGIEEHEAAVAEHRVVERSLSVSKIAMIAAIASAVAGIFSVVLSLVDLCG